MRFNIKSNALNLISGLIGLFVMVHEIDYYFSHLRRPGPSIAIAMCGLAILLISLSGLKRHIDA